MDNNDSVNGLIDQLEAMQKVMHWSHQEMAKRLGISYSYWMMLIKGQRQPGRAFFVGVVKGFPQLEQEAIDELRRM